MDRELLFLFEVILSGLFSGSLYSIIAVGFVLIYKSSGVFNFAQGAMVVFAAQLYATLADAGFNAFVAAFASIGAMVLLAILVEFLVLRRMINQSQTTLFMATIGVAFVLDGGAQWLFGSQIRPIDLALPNGLMEVGGMLIDQSDVATAVISAALIFALFGLLAYTSIGRSIRAVADDQQAAVSVGAPVHRIWILVWANAGFLAFVTGLIWGAKLGAQPALGIIALKALPVIILGGLTSIPGAIAGGLIIGVGERVFEVYLGSEFGGATESWFPYVLAICVLAFRPQGLFGEQPVRRI